MEIFRIIKEIILFYSKMHLYKKACIFIPAPPYKEYSEIEN